MWNLPTQQAYPLNRPQQNSFHDFFLLTITIITKAVILGHFDCKMPTEFHALDISHPCLHARSAGRSQACSLPYGYKLPKQHRLNLPPLI